MFLNGKTIIFHSKIRDQFRDLVSAMARINASNSLSGLSSMSLISKTINGNDYLYAQVRASDGKQRQICVGAGRYGEELRKRLCEDRKRERDFIEQTTKAMRGVGMNQFTPTPWRMISALAEGGIFKTGGVLFGDAAFCCIINFLGASLSSQDLKYLLREMDQDGIKVVLQRQLDDSEKPLKRLQKGISPLDEFRSVIEGSQSAEKVKFYRATWRVRDLPAEESTEKATKSLDPVLLHYVAESSVQALALGRRPILVNVPAPARYLIYLLIASQLPDVTQNEKYLQLASVLLEVMKQVQQDRFGPEKRSLRSWNREWVDLAEQGEEVMRRLYVRPKR